ncbi:hypothetical protein KCH_68080 [Kitasatospora cheerisanensis KCTC 2395]|uniref:Uncharacterized protein n=1 Tax=Kitasatospora cheerisanensis KCTC 2395 TaxID=1348663 RepID=A0A066YNC1_9ACTN|nr:hypothetical protein KCH_68080 [Kitasatospora cheerisanensis KCTC 2395]
MTGPGPACDSADFGSFSPEGAVVEWECLLAGGSVDALAYPGGAAHRRRGGRRRIPRAVARRSAALAAAGTTARSWQRGGRPEQVRCEA